MLRVINEICFLSNMYFLMFVAYVDFSIFLPDVSRSKSIHRTTESSQQVNENTLLPK